MGIVLFGPALALEAGSYPYHYNVMILLDTG